MGEPIKESKPTADTSVLMRGGCNLVLISRNMTTHAEKEFNWIAQGKTFRLDHSNFILNNYHEDLNKVPFIRERSFETQMFTGDFKAVVYGCIIDFGQNTYKHKATGNSFAAFGRSTDLTNLKAAPNRVATRIKTKYDIDNEWLEWFSKHFECTGGLTQNQFRQNILAIREQLPKKTKLILVNGSEVSGPFSKLSEDVEPNLHLIHKDMNQVIDELVKSHNGIECCDIRKWAKHRKDHTNNIRHYKKHVLVAAAKELDKMIT